VTATNSTASRVAATALRILEDEGPEAVTMRRVARDVGVTPMAIYHHFADREALLSAVTARGFDLLAAAMDRPPLAGRGRIRLLALMDYYVDYALARPRLFDYLFSRPRRNARRFPGDFRARKSPTLNRVADVVDACMRRGEINKDDVWEVALELWAHAHGYVALFRAGRFAISEREFRLLYRRSLIRLFDGLKTRKARHRRHDKPKPANSNDVHDDEQRSPMPSPSIRPVIRQWSR
jgi:AcrR family transcriptional regulator